MLKKFFVLIVIAGSFFGTVATGAPEETVVPDFASLSSLLKPAVVNISTSKTRTSRNIFPSPRGPYNDFFDDFFDRFFDDRFRSPRKERSLGSGFIISPDGYILTNDHVVDDADEVEVKLSDGRTFTATVKGLDRKLDLALLKIDSKEDLPVVKQGDSDELRVGEWVMAIGNPFGLEQTVTVGIVSAKGRVIGAGPYDNFIQTDASINPGNSGGPLFNTKGEAVGINTAIVAGGQGIGFAIPINEAKTIIPQLRDVGHVVRGWLGVAIQEVSPELAESFGLQKQRGALVSDVTEDSPAERGGIRRGDIILSFNGDDIDTMNDLPRLVAGTPSGTKVQVTVFRDGEKLDLSIEVGQLAEDEAIGSGNGGTLGLRVGDITQETARYFGLKGKSGAVVISVEPSGAASESKLRPGDLIIEVNGVEIASAQDFNREVQTSGKKKAFRLLVVRNDASFYTVLKTK